MHSISDPEPPNPHQEALPDEGTSSAGPARKARTGSTPESCPLCDTTGAAHYHQDRWRLYWQCHNCTLVFVPTSMRISRQHEKARYDQHRNDPSDLRYRRFLSRLADPLTQRVPAGAVGLDFGSGPGPTLGPMLTEAGLTVHLYDPLYAPDPEVWRRRYDFITASEVIEHLHTPQQELARLFSVLAPGGYLAIMTRWVTNRSSFADSRYIRDPTHVCFYSAEACHWIANKWNTSLEFPDTNVALFRNTPRALLPARS
jgi:SAM-dependent methyltransferase